MRSTYVDLYLKQIEMSRLEEIVCGKKATRIMIIIYTLWLIAIVILSYKNILTYLIKNQ
jgi:hypothetical protein